MKINNISCSTRNQINNNNSKANGVCFEAKLIRNPKELVTSIKAEGNSRTQRMLNSIARFLNNRNSKAENKILKDGGQISKKNILVDSYIPEVDDALKPKIQINSRRRKHND